VRFVYGKEWRLQDNFEGGIRCVAVDLDLVGGGAGDDVVDAGGAGVADAVGVGDVEGVEDVEDVVDAGDAVGVEDVEGVVDVVDVVGGGDVEVAVAVQVVVAYHRHTVHSLHFGGQLVLPELLDP
jgi:hypothetical protein